MLSSWSFRVVSQNSFVGVEFKKVKLNLQIKEEESTPPAANIFNCIYGNIILKNVEI